MIMNLTCTTEGCENYEVTIQYPDPVDLVLCGGCCNEVTRKEPVS
jgi:hypothetical protein